MEENNYGITQEDLDNLHPKAKYTQCTDEQNIRINAIRCIFSEIYKALEDVIKPGRETSLCMAKLEEAQFWAIKGISREGEKE